MKSVVALLFFVTFAFAVNPYMQCSTCGKSANNWYSSSSCANAGTLTKGESDFYTLVINSTTTVYYNYCGPISICNGGVACAITSGEEPVIFAYPNSETYIYTYYNQFQIQYYLSTGTRSYYFSISLTCSTSSSYQVTSYDLYSSSLYIYASSNEICGQASPTYYVYPRNFTQLSGNIYLSGQIPMFVMDKSSTPSSTFNGDFFFSQTYNSLRINGTLRANDGSGDTSQVAFIFDGQTAKNGNPATMVSYVTLPNTSNRQCILLPNTFDDDDSEMDWFQPEKNNYYYGDKSYTSIYFNKGTTFNVTAYSRNLGDSPYTTLLQRTSDGYPVFLGGSLLAPMVGPYDNPTFISELNWSTMSTSSFPSSVFDLPTSWGCQQ